MRAPARLALYGAGLAVAFGGAYGLAGVVIPDSVVESWTQQSQMNEHGESEHSDGAGRMSNDSAAQHDDGGTAGQDHPAG